MVRYLLAIGLLFKSRAAVRNSSGVVVGYAPNTGALASVRSAAKTERHFSNEVSSSFCGRLVVSVSNEHKSPILYGLKLMAIA